MRRALLAALLLLGSWNLSHAQINLPKEVNGWQPIIVGCNCVVPEGSEVTISWALTSEDPEGEASLVPTDSTGNKGHIWGTPGFHNLSATVVWLHFEILDVKLADGTTKKIKNLLNWDTQVYDHRFEIKGKGPPPTPPQENRPPSADAGDDKEVEVGDLVHLDASQSTDPDGDELTYQWNLVTPDGSSATLNMVDAIQPSFTADVAGEYTAKLVVSDGSLVDADASVVTAGAVAQDGPRHVIILEESEDRTPQQADYMVDLRQVFNDQADLAQHTLWIYDKDTRSSWLPSYERYRRDQNQSLPCIFIADKATQEVLYLGDMPATVESTIALLRAHGG